MQDAFLLLPFSLFLSARTTPYLFPFFIGITSSMPKSHLQSITETPEDSKPFPQVKIYMDTKSILTG